MTLLSHVSCVQLTMSHGVVHMIKLPSLLRRSTLGSKSQGAYLWSLTLPRGKHARPLKDPVPPQAERGAYPRLRLA